MLVLGFCFCCCVCVTVSSQERKRDDARMRAAPIGTGSEMRTAQLRLGVQVSFRCQMAGWSAPLRSGGSGAERALGHAPRDAGWSCRTTKQRHCNVVSCAQRGPSARKPKGCLAVVFWPRRQGAIDRVPLVALVRHESELYNSSPKLKRLWKAPNVPLWVGCSMRHLAIGDRQPLARG